MQVEHRLCRSRQHRSMCAGHYINYNTHNLKTYQSERFLHAMSGAGRQSGRFVTSRNTQQHTHILLLSHLFSMSCYSKLPLHFNIANIISASTTRPSEQFKNFNTVIHLPAARTSTMHGEHVSLDNSTRQPPSSYIKKYGKNFHVYRITNLQRKLN